MLCNYKMPSLDYTCVTNQFHYAQKVSAVFTQECNSLALLDVIMEHSNKSWHKQDTRRWKLVYWFYIATPPPKSFLDLLLYVRMIQKDFYSFIFILIAYFGTISTDLYVGN